MVLPCYITKPALLFSSVCAPSKTIRHTSDLQVRRSSLLADEAWRPPAPQEGVGEGLITSFPHPSLSSCSLELCLGGEWIFLGWVASCTLGLTDSEKANSFYEQFHKFSFCLNHPVAETTHLILRLSTVIPSPRLLPHPLHPHPSALYSFMLLQAPCPGGSPRQDLNMAPDSCLPVWPTLANRKRLGILGLDVPKTAVHPSPPPIGEPASDPLHFLGSARPRCKRTPTSAEIYLLLTVTPWKLPSPALGWGEAGVEADMA